MVPPGRPLVPLLVIGVRPNSPPQTMSVSFSMSRSRRSLINSPCSRLIRGSARFVHVLHEPIMMIPTACRVDLL